MLIHANMFVRGARPTKACGTGIFAPNSAYVEHKKPPQDTGPYLITQCLLGWITGLFWGSVLLATNTAGIWDLLSASPYPAATSALFLIGSVMAILPVVLAAAIGRLAE